jgi:hypothetical protein
MLSRGRHVVACATETPRTLRKKRGAIQLTLTRHARGDMGQASGGITLVQCHVAHVLQ